MSKYRELAKLAVKAEKKGRFEEAAKMWTRARDYARGSNQAWAFTRIGFCSSAVRNGWGAWA